MCGRFALRADRREIHALEGNNVNVDEWNGEDDFVPRYNIAPRTNVPVIRRSEPSFGPGAASNSGSTEEPQDASSTDSKDSLPLVMQTMKWGLVPHWSKVEDKSLNTINARAENLVAGGGMWGGIKGSRRCAVPCQGYYEWLTKGKDKLPHFLKRKDGHLLLMAGLYDSAVIDGQTLWTFTIVTTEANKEFAWLHDRQPVFLTSKDVLDTWLDTRTPSWTDTLSRMVSQSYHDDSVPLECYQVPQEVGKVGTESPTFIEPVASRKDGIQAFFSKQMTQHSGSSQPQPSTPPSSISKPVKSPAPSSSPSKSKRKRVSTPSPDIDLSANDDDPQFESHGLAPPGGSLRPEKMVASPRKRKHEESPGPKAKKAKPTEETELAQKAPKSPVKSKAKAATPSPKKIGKAKVDGGTEGPAKITAFFDRRKT